MTVAFETYKGEPVQPCYKSNVSFLGKKTTSLPTHSTVKKTWSEQGNEDIFNYGSTEHKLYNIQVTEEYHIDFELQIHLNIGIQTLKNKRGISASSVMKMFINLLND